MLRRIHAIILKEIYHILRDPRTLTVIFAMPIVMVILFGYALNMDIKHIPIGFIDRDNSSESRNILRSFSASEYFDITAFPESRDNIESLFRSGAIKAALVIPKGFGEDLMKLPVSHIQILVDGADPTFGNVSVNYASAILHTYTMNNAMSESIVPFEVRERFLYNPDLKGSNFIIPGIVAVILMMVCALLTSITIAREKETGTMEILLVSPVKPPEIIIGKVIPYIILAIIDAVFILVFAHIVFHIPIRGNLLLLFVLSILYVYSALSIGLLISSIAPTQQVAMMAALVVTILPSIILSGFIFSIFSMPAPIRLLTYIVPARFYMLIIRGILLKSSTVLLLKENIIMLAILGTLFLAIATAKFKTRSHT